MHIRMDAGLKEFAEEYARKRGTTTSALVIRFLVNLREADRVDREKPEDAESI